MTNFEINILHLYPDLLNLYGDKGNIESMRKRLEWRDITVNITEYTQRDSGFDIENSDIIFIGGGSDRETEIVRELLQKRQEELKNYVEKGGTLVALCGGFPLLGRYYQTPIGTVDGLDILNITTEINDARLISDVVLDSDKFSQKIIGFENHATKTDIGQHTPLGKVLVGNGNDGESGFEGVLYKNVLASYLHGPLFPKNPQLCDHVLRSALNQKYPKFGELSPLNDELENLANEQMFKTLTQKA
ncbi:MAG: glutamine amidotransferase [Oscillospiraceae bacterium]